LQRVHVCEALVEGSANNIVENGDDGGGNFGSGI
jgi:hypothetical protein